jgi:hypothetical protein
MAYMLRWDVVMNLYQALTRSGKGGPIADAIMVDGDEQALEEWCINAIPDALGPLLKTLISPPEAFTIKAFGSKDATGGQPREYDQSQAYALQQRAISRILGWIVKNAKKTNSIDKAQRQFELACMSMNEFGIKDTDAELSYCKNRSELDAFMYSGSRDLFSDRSTKARENYKADVALLGANLSDFCTKNYIAIPSYSPSGATPYLKNY